MRLSCVEPLRPSVAREAGLPDSPLEQLPIWFIEGSAEYYAKRGLDPEAEVLVRDLVVNPTEAKEGVARGGVQHQLHDDECRAP